MSMSLLIVVITAYRAAAHRRPADPGVAPAGPRVPASEEVLRHAARQFGTEPGA